jgi:hypothetical protein
MTFLLAKAWKDGVVGRRLRELRQHLAEIRRRVAEAVTEAVRETIAKLARDAVGRILPRLLLTRPCPSGVTISKMNTTPGPTAKNRVRGGHMTRRGLPKWCPSPLPRLRLCQLPVPP